jgi:hypothetical protein
MGLRLTRRVLKPLSICAAFSCGVLAARTARCVQAQRIAVVVGNNVGLSGEAPLRYAESEAAALSKILLGIGGVRPNDLYLLQGKPASQVWRVLDQVQRRAAEISREGTVMVLFYFSGHGSRRALHLGGDKISLQRIRRSLKRLKARTVIAFFDACQSGSLVRRKGIRRQPRFDIRVDRRDLARGRVFITSSGEFEASMEADDVGGSYFSHYLLSGLRGNADRNADGLVDLNEIYRFTYHRTVVKSSTSRAGVQHPSFDFDLRGSGDVVVTWPVKADTGLVLERGLAGDFLIVSRYGQEVVAEVTGRPGRSMHVALPRRSYVVKKRVRGGYLVGAVNLTWGGNKTLRRSAMRFVPYARAARKGRAVEPLPPNEASALVSLRTGVASGNPFLLGARAGYRRTIRGAWIVGAAASFHRGELSGPEVSAPTSAAGVEARGGYGLRWGRWRLSGGGWLGGALIWQTLDGQEDRRSFTFLGGLLAGVSWHVADPLVLHLEVRAGLEVAKLYDDYGVRPLVAAAVGPGILF